jgi:hypothetical protein
MKKEKIPATLHSLQSYLKNQGYNETAIQPSTDFTPVDQLLISLQKDSDGSDIILHLFWSKGPEEENQEDTSMPRFLQFFILFPFLADEKALKDLTTLILNLNANFDMASFGLYESERLMYYRYVHLHSPSQIESENLLAIISSIEFLLEMFLPSLLDVGLGRKSLWQVHKEAEESAKNQNLEF